MRRFSQDNVFAKKTVIHKDDSSAVTSADYGDISYPHDSNVPVKLDSASIGLEESQFVVGQEDRASRLSREFTKARCKEVGQYPRNRDDYETSGLHNYVVSVPTKDLLAALKQSEMLRSIIPFEVSQFLTSQISRRPQ